MRKGQVVAVVMIGEDKHKGSHTAVALGAGEVPLGQVRVRASAAQAERLLTWGASLAGVELGGGGRWRARYWLVGKELVAAGEEPCWTCSRSWPRGCGCWLP